MQFQVWRDIDGLNAYGISRLKSSRIEFKTQQNTDLFTRHEIIESDSKIKKTLKEYLKGLIKQTGIHPIYNSKNKIVEQIVNIPQRILSSDEIIKILNKYTILSQETPPWDEIIFRLPCYSEDLTNDYYKKLGIDYLHRPVDENDFDSNFLAILDKKNKEADSEKHYFATKPKVFEENRGIVFMFINPHKSKRKWVKLEEYYDHKQNAWVDPDKKTIVPRTGKPVKPINLSKSITKDFIKQSYEDYLSKGGTVKKLPCNDPWKNYKIHELALEIPETSKDQKDRLENDILKNGLFDRLILHEGKILDGRTRYGICLKHNIEPKFKLFDGPGSARAFVMSKNFYRRHFTASQIAAMGVDRYLEGYEKEAAERKVKNGGKKPEVQKVEPPVKGKAYCLLADFLKTNKQYIFDAKKIKEKDPKIFEKILSGEITIQSAKRKLFPSKPNPKKKPKTFNNRYKSMLKNLIERPSTSNNLLALKKIVKIYLEWNGKNNTKMNKKLDGLREEFPFEFGAKDKNLKLILSN